MCDADGLAAAKTCYQAFQRHDIEIVIGGSSVMTLGTWIKSEGFEYDNFVGVCAYIALSQPIRYAKHLRFATGQAGRKWQWL